MNININKETLQKVGEVGLKVGKRVIIEGTKAVVLKGTIATLEAKFEGKEVTLDTMLGDTNKSVKEKKSFFGRKKKVKVDEEELHEILTEVAETAFEAGEIAEMVEDMVLNKKEGDKSEEA